MYVCMYTDGSLSLSLFSLTHLFFLSACAVPAAALHQAPTALARPSVAAKTAPLAPETLRLRGGGVFVISYNMRETRIKAHTDTHTTHTCTHRHTSG